MVGAPVPLVLPRLTASAPIVDPRTGIPTGNHVQTLKNAFQNISTNFNALQAAETLLAAQQAEQATLTQNLADALTALAAVQGQVSAVASAQSSFALAGSFTAPAVVLSSTTTNGTATITVAAHVRRYADGSSKSVTGATITPPAKGASFWVYYMDVPRSGGSVSYQTTSDATTAAQLAGVHCVGSVYVSTGNATNVGTANLGPGVQPLASPGAVA